MKINIKVEPHIVQSRNRLWRHISGCHWSSIDGEFFDSLMHHLWYGLPDYVRDGIWIPFTEALSEIR